MNLACRTLLACFNLFITSQINYTERIIEYCCGLDELQGLYVYIFGQTKGWSELSSQRNGQSPKCRYCHVGDYSFANFKRF